MNMFGFTFYHILRDHSLGTLADRDTARLRDYQTLLGLRIGEKQAIMNRPNILSTERSELAEDVRWYTRIDQEIATLLTGEFHRK